LKDKNQTGCSSEAMVDFPNSIQLRSPTYKVLAGNRRFQMKESQVAIKRHGMKIIKIIPVTWLLFTFSYAQVNFTRYALVNATVIDANHQSSLGHQTVVIEGNKIAQIFTDGSKTLPPADVVINLHGKYLLPGFIDTHVHLATDPSQTDNRASTLRTLDRMLFSGITSVRDMAGDARILAGLSRDAKIDEIPSPDIYFSALMAGPQFFSDPRTVETTRGGIAGQMPYMLAVSDSTDLVLAVAEAKGTGASGIKLYADLSAQLVTRIVAEANRQNLRVWGHAWLQSARPSDLVRAGVGSISHANLLLYEHLDSIPRSWKTWHHSSQFWKDSIADYSALFKLMKQNHTLLDATLAVYGKLSKEDTSYQFAFEASKRITAAAYKAGVRICAGTDDDQEGLVQNEMHLLVHEAGFSAIDAIVAATRNGSQAIGIENLVGTVEENKQADLVILDKNPLEDIDNVKSVYMTIKSGKIYKK
jgi:imidazolonepropionase-like amidohydrolase